jgi:L-ribulokinase
MGGSSTVSKATCVVGVDYGTLSGRALVVRVSDGAELGTAVHEYRHGVLEDALPSGRRLPPDWALQYPGDYIDVLRVAVPAAVAAAGVSPADIVGLATDFTACTVLPTTADGTPLCQTPEFADEPHAWVKLWKHHAAQGQADRINELARKRGEPWLPRYGGKISAEWQFAKALQVLEEAPDVYAATERWIEAADWIIWQLCGDETRNACTAGYKGIFQDGNYPSADYLAELNPGFASFVTDKLEFPLSPLGGRAGSLTEEAALWTGLPAGIAVAARRRVMSSTARSWQTCPECAVWSMAESSTASSGTRLDKAELATSMRGSPTTLWGRRWGRPPKQLAKPSTNTSAHSPASKKWVNTACWPSTG